MQRGRRRLRSSRIDTGAVAGLISIVLPVYNGERYLKEAVTSVLEQTETHWELWIVNDGSTDASGKIAEEFAARDSRIHVIHQENKKLPAALNRGFSAARGEFYTWLSADNRMLPHGLACMAKALRRHPSWDMVYGNEYVIDDQGMRQTGHGWFEWPPNSGRVCFPPISPMLNIVPNNTIGAAFMYRAGAEAVLDGYSEALYLLEDYDYFMRMNTIFRIHHIKERAPIYEYRFHQDSLTAQDQALGITARRPKLMAYDAVRRREYQRPIQAAFCGFSAAQKRLFCRCGFTDGAEVTLSVSAEDAVSDSDYDLMQTADGYVIRGRDGLCVKTAKLWDAAAVLRDRIHCRRWRSDEEAFFEK